MTSTIGIGMIGMGWMGEVHSRSYRAILDRFYESGIQPRLVVCADAVEARAQAAQQRFGFESYTTDWRAVIANPTAEAGKHILCEKPVGRDPQETIQSAAAARETGVLTFVGYNYRWAPLVQYARQLIAQGKLGQVTHYHGRFLNGYAADPHGFLSWRFEQEHGLGTLDDLLSHVIDLAHMLVGPITRVTSDKAIFIRKRPIPQPGSGTHFDV